MKSPGQGAEWGWHLRASRRPVVQAGISWRRERAGGGHALDLLASNAGVEHFGALETIAQAAAAAMTDGGRIVLSSCGSVRLAVHHHALYAASTAVIPAMVRNLAPELAERNIKTNAIAPGTTATRTAGYPPDYAPRHGRRSVRRGHCVPWLPSGGWASQTKSLPSSRSWFARRDSPPAPPSALTAAVPDLLRRYE